MLAVLWRLTRGYRLRPWKSPYLRWRMETYWGTHAERITFGEFWKFVWAQRRDLLRYLRWAGRMNRIGSNYKPRRDDSSFPNLLR